MSVEQRVLHEDSTRRVMKPRRAVTGPDWSAEVDARLRAHVAALLATHDLVHWHALVTVLHPAVVMFAAAALRRARGTMHAATAVDEQALDVALLVCGDLRRNGYRRLALFQGLHDEAGAPLRGYIAKITRQTAFRFLRTQILGPDGERREVTAEARSVGLVTLERVPGQRGPDTGARVARHILVREHELQLLTEQQRDLFELYLSGHSPAEIAAVREVDAATAQRVIRSAKAKLKYHFGRQEDER
ncbi:MAG: sigma-70 family RNA polymerase sigma factor [Deltaproteobacteria bacterium]|nr:sigma-70 family RNA polymerase sigma factor [Deltaproteobacteria bacterium]